MLPAAAELLREYEKEDPYAGMTYDDEFRLATEILSGMTLSAILAIPGVWDEIREELNNDILDAWTAERQAEGPVVRCPSYARHPEDIVGCGSANVVQMTGEDEGVYECLNCGIWFDVSQEAGQQPAAPVEEEEAPE